MSRTIDERVVEMRFDNRNFESNVSTTLSTLDKLKQSLNLTGAVKGFDNVSSAANRVNLSGLSSGVETIHAKFSALEVMAVTTLANITNSAVNAGKRIASALTIDPIKTGFQEYETQINAVQTILANTSTKGTNITDVNKALDELNTYADKTIYNFTEMTRNIGTFTAAGVDLDTSVKSIKGIANLAAVSGSSSQQASTAMYQLSQALAAGKVNLQDWNSVVNAGMGGQVFQDALKRTAKNMGKDVDGMIKKYGSFRESLSKGEWLTTDVLTKTLEQFTMAAKEGSEEWENYKKSLMDEGYTEKQAIEILKMANTATDAATKVKTFTQLWDTLKESVQSGWTQSWEYIIGDFEEARATLTKVSDTLNEVVGKSAEARNKLLKGWKEAGGRDDLLAGFSNAWKGLVNIAKPIKEAFREIFPQTTVDQLVNFTKNFKELTASFAEFTSKHSGEIKSTFKGLFAVIDIIATVIKEVAGGAVDLIGNLTGLGGGILGLTGSFGDWLVNLRDTIKETDVLGTAIDKIVSFISNAIRYVKNFGSAMKDSFDTPGFETFAGGLKVVWDLIVKIGSKVGDMFSKIGSGISEAMGESNFGNIINSGLFAGILIGIGKFVKGITDPLDGVNGVLENITGILDDVRDCFAAYQTQLQAGTLIKIATAIGVLAGSLFIISTIEPAALERSLGGITVLFAELLGAMKLFTMMSTDIKGVTKACAAMISMSISISILAGALKKMSSLSWEQIGRGLVAIGVLMAEISIFMSTAKIDGKMTRTALGIVVLSSAMLILAQAVKAFGGMHWNEIGKGLASIGVLLAEIALFTNLTGNAKHVISTGASMVLLGASMKIFASAVKDFATMKWDEIGRGLTAMAGALAAITLALRFMPKNMIAMGVGLLAVAGSLVIIEDALQGFTGMSWDEIGRGLVAMGGALAELAIALRLMTGTASGSAALLIAAGALAIMTPVLKSLGNMSWEQIGKGLITLAGAFAVVGVAGLLLGPLVPTILGLAGSFALFGLSIVGIGAGLTLIGVGLTAIATGFTALATAGAAGATAFVAALTVIITGIVDLIPTVILGLGDGVLALCKVIKECAPAIADTVLSVVAEILASLATYTPQIVDSLVTFLIGVLDTLATRLPELVTAAVNFIGSFFQGIVDALNGVDTASIFKGIIGVGLLTGLMMALSAVVGFIPGAMAGVLGMGIIIAELALVLAAVGALAQIPGLQWLIGEGGQLLQSIGTAIGQFVGGIVGGFMGGVSSTFPQIGSDLAAFMTNVQPFIDGAKNIDSSMLDGVNALAKTILILTGASLLESLTSWVSGGQSLGDFAAQLVPFGKSMKEYAAEVTGIDTAAITASASAAKSLAAVAKSIPADGDSVWGIIAGEKNLGSFGQQLVPFGKSMKSYAAEVAGLDGTSIQASVQAAKGLVQVAKAIPNSEDSLWGIIAGGKNLGDFGKQLVPFGAGMKSYAAKVEGLNTSAITSSVTAAKALVKVAKALPKSDDGVWGVITGKQGLDDFGKKLTPFGKAMKSYSSSVSGINVEAINNSVSAAKKLVSFLKSLNGFEASGVSSFKSALNTLGKVSVDNFIKSFKNANADLKDIGGKMVTSISNGIKAKQDTLTKTVKTIVKEIADAFDSKKTAFTDTGKALMDALNKGLSGQNGKIKSTTSNTVKAATTGIKGNYSSFYNAGAYLATGFANGISANTYKAKAKARAMAAAAADAAKAELKEHSPSKVGFEIGDFFGVGFINGIANCVDQSYKAGAGMANSARTGLREALVGIQDAIDSDMNVQPTIRPVLDLSSVKAGANSISSILGAGSSSRVLANVRSIGSVGRDMSNAEVVSAINKLGKKMDNVGNTTYSIGGITYDDGTNVSNAIKDLIHAAKIERRV